MTVANLAKPRPLFDIEGLFMGQLRTANKRRKSVLLARETRAKQTKIVVPTNDQPAPAAK